MPPSEEPLLVAVRQIRAAREAEFQAPEPDYRAAVQAYSHALNRIDRANQTVQLESSRQLLEKRANKIIRRIEKLQELDEKREKKRYDLKRAEEARNSFSVVESVEKSGKRCEAEVIGLKTEIETVCEIIRMPEKSRTFVDGRPKTTEHILLYGPPQVGKSLLTEVLADEFPAYSRIVLNPEDLADFGAPLIEAVFSRARSCKPCFVVLENMQHHVYGEGENLEKNIQERLAAQFTNSHDVQIVGVTNSPWTLSSRMRSFFPHQVLLHFPDTQSKLQYLQEKFQLLDHNITESSFDLIVNGTEELTARELKEFVDLCAAKIDQLKAEMEATPPPRNASDDEVEMMRRKFMFTLNSANQLLRAMDVDDLPNMAPYQAYQEALVTPYYDHE